MSNFTFVVPSRIVFGWGSLEMIREELQKLNENTVLIATSKGMVKRRGFSDLVRIIKEEKRTPVVFNKVDPEPSVEDVERCLEVTRENECNLIVGLGGGSVMDVAKKVAMDLDLPKIMIPTTAGTGSEVTHESVLKTGGKKRTFVDEKLTADVAIVDPSLMITMPRRLIASSGIDALAHSVESYNCKRGNELTKILASKAYIIIINNVRRALAHNKEAISSMALGSLIAGMAFGNSGTALCHALSYPLSNMGIPHGEAVAIMLPLTLEFNNHDQEVVREVKEIINSAGLPRKVTGDPEKMAKTVMMDKRHLSNNPKKVTHEDVVEIFKKVAE